MAPTNLLFLLSATATSALTIAAPKPQVAVVNYAGSACPAGGGIGVEIGALDETSNIAPLTFTLPNFTPTLGSFSSSLRMCDVIANITVEPGYKVVVNARGTKAQGYATADSSTTLGFRSTYQFRHNYEVQSVGMLNVEGPVSGSFARSFVPNDGDTGVVSECQGGEIDVEFQSRAARDIGEQDPPGGVQPPPVSNQTTWTLTTDIEVFKC